MECSCTNARYALWNNYCSNLNILECVVSDCLQIARKCQRCNTCTPVESIVTNRRQSCRENYGGQFFTSRKRRSVNFSDTGIHSDRFQRRTSCKSIGTDCLHTTGNHHATHKCISVKSIWKNRCYIGGNRHAFIGAKILHKRRSTDRHTIILDNGQSIEFIRSQLRPFGFVRRKQFIRHKHLRIRGTAGKHRSIVGQDRSRCSYNNGAEVTDSIERIRPDFRYRTRKIHCLKLGRRKRSSSYCFELISEIHRLQ